MALLADMHSTAMPGEMVPFVPYVLLYGLKTLFGLESVHALPALLCSDEALRPLVASMPSSYGRACATGGHHAAWGAGSRAGLPRFPGQAEREAEWV